MYFMYVDESGDCGLNNSPTKYFVLTGLVIHELRWKQCLESLLDRAQQVFGCAFGQCALYGDSNDSTNNPSVWAASMLADGAHGTPTYR
jgi:hypothetical protein